MWEINVKNIGVVEESERSLGNTKGDKYEDWLKATQYNSMRAIQLNTIESTWVILANS